MTAPAEVQAQGAPVAEATPDAAAPVLITLQEVAFSTAAAMPVRQTRRWSATPSGFLTAMRKMLAASTSEMREPRRDQPRRYSYLEYASMSRAMDRL